MGVAKELHNFHPGAPPIPVPPPPPTIPAPVVHRHGPVSNALSQAIRAGAPEVAEEVGKGGSLFGGKGQLVHSARGVLHSEAIQGLFEAEGGAGSGGFFPGVGVCGMGGLSLDDQETNWGWALMLMSVIQTISYGVFGFFSYLDIMRTPAVS